MRTWPERTSRYDGHIGASAVFETGWQKQSQMGTEDIATVYVAELQGVEMAPSEVKRGSQKERWSEPLKNAVVIFADSQTALQAIGRPKMPSGQVDLESCLNNLGWITAEGIKVEVSWIPVHENIVGNELANGVAKEAALNNIRWHQDNRYIVLGSAIKRRMERQAKQA